MSYADFLKELDKNLQDYFDQHKKYIYCKKGCSLCCENGDYPISQAELEYLMQGYISLDNKNKKLIQENIKNMERGKACPFLLDNKCLVYQYRPIICRTHGLAYLCKENTVKLPYCANYGKNYHDLLSNGEFFGEPIQQNLDTRAIFKDCGEIRNLFDWLQ